MTSVIGFSSQALLNFLSITLKNRRTAPMTPNKDAPAINPEAISVPRWVRASTIFSFFELLLTICAIKPPMIRGVFKCKRGDTKPIY